MEPNNGSGSWIDRLLNKFVLIRSNESGVWIGKLVGCSPNGDILTLEQARRIRYWEGAIDCSDIRVNGVAKTEETKIMIEEEFQMVRGWCECGPLTEVSKDILYSIKGHQYGG